MNMNAVKVVTGERRVIGARFGLVVSRFNDFITERLLKGALETLLGQGARESDLRVAWVPGAFEIPLAVQRMAANGQHDAVIALGCVIRGGTPHFDYVAGSCVNGLGRVMLESSIPVSLGVLTVDTIEQAIERAGAKAGNKGVDAALSAIEMVNLLPQLAAGF